MSMPFDLSLRLRVSSTLTSRSTIPALEFTLNMSNWITEEANKNNAQEHDEAIKQRLINASNYWGSLLRQVEADVNAINQHPYWMKKLIGSPLHFGQDFTGQGYQISKSGNPAVMITFRNLGDHIHVERNLDDVVAQGFSAEEDLFVGTSGQNVVLHTEGKKSFVIPED